VSSCQSIVVDNRYAHALLAISPILFIPPLQPQAATHSDLSI
jgi:hypothetical protein